MAVTIGQRIAGLLEKMEGVENRKITITELSCITGVPRSKLNMVLTDYVDSGNGKVRTLTSEQIMSLCTFFHVTPTFLLTGNNDENVTVVEELGLSNNTINNLKQMDSDILQAFERLINDPLYGMALVSFMSNDKQGLWLDGKQIAKDNDFVTIGNPAEYSEAIRVSDLVASHRQRHILQLLQAIKNDKENGK